jgi:hypothetical protein
MMTDGGHHLIVDSGVTLVWLLELRWRQLWREKEDRDPLMDDWYSIQKVKKNTWRRESYYNTHQM